MAVHTRPSIDVGLSAPQGDLITSLAGSPPREFFSCPYFPFDLCLTHPVRSVRTFLEQNINQLFTQKFSKKGKLGFVAAIQPGKRALSGPYLKSTPSTAKVLATAMFTDVRNYVQANNAASVGEIIRFVDGNANALLPELAVQVLVESNSTRVGAESVLRAWDLMMMLTERYAFTDQIYLVLRSYFLAAAALPAVDSQIRQKATICLLRLRSGPRPTGDDATMDFKNGSSPVEYMQSCTSMNRIFGVSLAEILFKE
jgi:hypothetical protein